jgi:hypothetical protein
MREPCIGTHRSLAETRLTMARNIELKARDPDPARSLQLSLAIGAKEHGWLQQLDTYFRIQHGRLKLREQDGSAELIQYERPDEAIERASNYRIIPIHDPDGLNARIAEQETPNAERCVSCIFIFDCPCPAARGRVERTYFWGETCLIDHLGLTTSARRAALLSGSGGGVGALHARGCGAWRRFSV